MAHIPEREIERLKRDVALVALLKQQGFKLQKQGKDYATCCPFHDDKTPSLVITPDKNLFHCFGCGAAGSVIDWMMRLEGVSFRKAVMLLQEQNPSSSAANVALEQTAKEPPKLSSNDSHKSVDNSEVQALLNKTVDHYHSRLLESEVAQDYLAQRGLSDPVLWQTFKLGFCDRKLGQVLASRQSQQGKRERELLNQVGVLLDSGIERFSGSLVVPTINNGNVLEVYGRKVSTKLRKGTPLHLYLPGEHRGLWNRDGLVEGIKHQREIILCESLIDALTLWQHGFTNITTSYGVNGFTGELHRFLQDHQNSIDAVLIAYDRDKAGNAAATNLIETLAKDGLTGIRLPLPPEMDINEWALQEGGDFKAVFRECVTQAKASLSHQMPENNNDTHTEINAPEIPPPAALEKPGNGLVKLTYDGLDLHTHFGQRHYRVRGLEKNKHREQLKINIMTKYQNCFFIDTLDLYHAKHRQHFIKQASIECGVDEDVLKGDLGRLLLALEHEQEGVLQQEQAPTTVELSEAEKTAALDYLRDPSLLSRVIKDVNACGLVGEDTNAVVAYLAGVSRKLEKPLAVMIQSTSAAGKSTLMDAVLNLMPEEERVQYSAMTGQSLYYLGETDVKHKILAIAEEEGASNASYALKLLQSEGEITIASTGKDDSSGDLVTKEYTVEGPVMLLLTTTAIDIDEELLNRCLVLTVNESQEQTEAIHAQQRFNDTLEGLLAKTHKSQLQTLHHNVQRLLKPLHVVNPFAEQLTFLSHQTRTRRDHQKYLTLIKSITLLHQYQREIKTLKTGEGDKALDYIEVVEQDIVHANALAREVLGRTLDELPPQTRKLLTLITQYVAERSEAEKIAPPDVRFSRRDIRAYSGWGNTQIAVHCQRLEEMEYMIVHSGQRGKLLRYQLCYDHEGQSLALHLRDPHHLDPQLSGDKPMLSGSNRPQIGGVSGLNRGDQHRSQPNSHKALTPIEPSAPANSIVLDENTALSTQVASPQVTV